MNDFALVEAVGVEPEMFIISNRLKQLFDATL